jgi:hypothetical protein
MKFKLFACLLLIGFGKNGIAQDQTTLAKFIIQDARLNHADVTQVYLNAGHYLSRTVGREDPGRAKGYQLLSQKSSVYNNNGTQCGVEKYQPAWRVQSNC